MATVADHDPVARKLVQEGMLVEAFSWKLMDESSLAFLSSASP